MKCAEEILGPVSLSRYAEQERQLTENLLWELAKTLNNISAILGSLKKGQIFSKRILKLLEYNVEYSREVKDGIYLEYAKSLVHGANYIGPDMHQEQCKCILAWNDQTPVTCWADQMQLAKVILKQLSGFSQESQTILNLVVWDSCFAEKYFCLWLDIWVT